MEINNHCSKISSILFKYIVTLCLVNNLNETFDSLPSDKFFDTIKLKAFADDKLKFNVA